MYLVTEYGMVNLKVHAKICLIIRKESDGIRRYLHLSTGNYNPKTARLYQDFSLFTSNSDLALDATLFFNVVSGYSIVQSMHSLSMAPVNIKSRLIEMIEREINYSRGGNPGLIIAKMNSLCHDEIIEELYKASAAGVRVMLNIRGICTLVPGVKGMSENIEVSSVVGRYLEHSRIYIFGDGEDARYFIASADWMTRNMSRRVEVGLPITGEKEKALLEHIFDLLWRDNHQARVMQPDGTYVRRFPEDAPPLLAQAQSLQRDGIHR